ncbi:MAG: methyltransferase, CheR-type, SAM-binding domain, C-terminal [Gemmatimonadetes bacterium]|nr:methyltransferase, CheR-type, SAM-binding domain, C-terminal [Gemmatimonadota bacterium]
MLQHHDRPPLTDAAYTLLRDLILQRTGMVFDQGKRDLLADKLSELVASLGLTSFLDYYYLLRYDDAAEEHWARLMDRLSVPETYFWRQAEQFEALADIVAPAHFARKQGALRIWSAACCTGEEAISIAMALDRVGLLEGRGVQIRASDGSEAMVDRARAATYGERSFRQMPVGWRERYFDQAPDGRWRPLERIRDHIQYSVANLVRPEEVLPLAAADVIFCRNVFIYFSDDAIRSVVETFARAMPRGAHLFLGASESLTRLGVDFDLQEMGKGFVYVRSANAGLATATNRVTT